VENQYSVCIVGLWHLGCVTASCLSSIGIKTIAFDPDKKLVDNLKRSISPIYEPGMQDLISEGLRKKNLYFTSNINEIRNHNIYWITYDTPVDYDDTANVNYIIDNIHLINKQIKSDSNIIISSQLPVGTCEFISNIFKTKYNKKIRIFYLPENLRLGNALKVFLKPDRIVVGKELDSEISEVKKLIDKISSSQIWMSNKSAEMSKHAINSFLATSVVFANEIGAICDEVGANPDDVALSLKSDQRIGRYAYLTAGGPFAGGTLARDVVYLNNYCNLNNIKTPLLSSIIKSNQNHKEWIIRSLNNDFRIIKNFKILILGLSYKSGTNTLRRSHSLEIANFLSDQNLVYLYDPIIEIEKIKLPKNQVLINDLSLLDTNIDILIITKNWPDQLSEIKKQIGINNKHLFIYDINRTLKEDFKKLKDLDCSYKTIGK
tara:strand:+ start:561 stop:1859 length:1299 start_codon:yes stop_codon:yes gene_type:complete